MIVIDYMMYIQLHFILLKMNRHLTLSTSQNLSKYPNQIENSLHDVSKIYRQKYYIFMNQSPYPTSTRHGKFKTSPFSKDIYLLI